MVELRLGSESKLESQSQDFIQEIDPSLMTLLITNLFSNCIKYASPKRDLVVKLYQIDENTLALEDNGIGMSNQECQEATNFFKRHHIHSNIEGSGLGLGISKQIANMHDAVLAVEPAGKFGVRVKIKFSRGKS